MKTKQSELRERERIAVTEEERKKLKAHRGAGFIVHNYLRQEFFSPYVALPGKRSVPKSL